MNSISLIICGDLVPTKSNIDIFSNGEISKIVDERIIDKLDNADFRIFNLEVPLTDKSLPIQKFGPNLIAPTSSIKGIKTLNPSLLCLANNHILDQNEQGLTSTIELLQKYNIDYVGAGENIFKASKPYIIEKEGRRIGVYACAEHEFTIATNNTPGANPFDSLESLDHIQNLKAECDYVIVLYHGGKEHYRYPSPYLQKVCRKMALKGADLVICQHSHCIGCSEAYGDSTIVYGQGNFLFDDSENEFWKTSLIIRVTINDGFDIDYIPIVKVSNGIRQADGQVAEDILIEFYRRSDEILQDGFVEQYYRRFAQENKQSYLKSFSGFSKWVYRIDRRLLNGILLKRKYNKKQLLAIQNFIECEAHRELILACLKGENYSERK